MRGPLKRYLFVALLATLAWSFSMALETGNETSGDFRKPDSCTHFNAQPILDLELASSPECFLAVTQQGDQSFLGGNARLLRTNTYMDFAFIGLYSTVFVLLALVMDSRFSKWVIGLVSLAALFDVLENVGILRGLRDLLASGHVNGVLPRPFSLVKWSALGFVLASLGVLVWSRKDFWSRLFGAALFASGVLTVVGLVKAVVMTYAGYSFGLVLLLSLLWLWSPSLASILDGIEYAYLMRFQVLIALVLAVGLPVADRKIPSLFIGIFDGRGFWSFAFIVWAAFQLAWTVMVTSRLVLVYGPQRFGRARTVALHRVGSGIVFAFGLLAVPPVVVLWIGTSGPSEISKAVAISAGLAAAIGVLALTAYLHFAIEHKNGKTAESVFPSFGVFHTTESSGKSHLRASIDSRLARLPADLTAGILDRGRLRSGHEMAAISLGVFLVVYVVIGLAYSPAWSTPERQPAALFFLLFLLTIFTWLFSGAAFFLDRIRLPVLTSLLVASLLTGFVRTDHKYAVTPGAASDDGGLRPSDVIHSWEKGRGKNGRAITIVATAGGGIRAAAWTAEVMTRLQRQCRESLSSSVLLVSSVSGGSVGSMFVVGPYDSETGAYPVSDTDLESIRFNASRSSLSAVGWGLAYPDLVRTAPFVGGLVPETFDRGWSLENAWATAWRQADQPFMSEWRNDVRAGTRPAVIFNATVAENGERFLIASTDTISDGTKRFFDLFPGSDIRVATAARLSATFPYVSPLARPSVGPVENAFHVGDGGYYDNSGLLSATEWLRDASDALQDHPVLLILIDAKPGPAAHGSTWSWQKQLVGPIETLLNVRTSSQQLRDSLDLDMAVDYLATQSVRVIPAPFLFETQRPAPLSWHLTPDQIQEIGASWEDDPNVQSRGIVYKALGCPAEK